jgi:acetylornithine/N-succinyldiaminopimelate aminotransferase
LKEGVLVNQIGGTIRIAPPLTVSRTEVRAALDTFRSGVDALTAVVEVDTAAVA